jgi:hypothetical protein
MRKRQGSHDGIKRKTRGRFGGKTHRRSPANPAKWAKTHTSRVHAYIPSKSEPLYASGAAWGRDEGNPVANHTSRCLEFANLCHWAERLHDVFAAVDVCEGETEDTVTIASETCRPRGSTFVARAEIRRSGPRAEGFGMR